MADTRSTIKQRILAKLPPDGPGLTGEQVADLIGFYGDIRTVARHLAELAEEGSTRRQKRPVGASVKRFDASLYWRAAS